MQIRPNRSLILGIVTGLAPAPSGQGSELDIVVERCEAADGLDDFVRARPGDIVRAFAPDAAGIERGGACALTVSVLGGPVGERIVVERVQTPPPGGHERR